MIPSYPRGKKQITLPTRHDPGAGYPTEYLAYMTPEEAEMLRQMTDGTVSRGPRGIPSFAMDSASSKGVSRGGNGAVGSGSTKTANGSVSKSSSGSKSYSGGGKMGSASSQSGASRTGGGNSGGSYNGGGKMGSASSQSGASRMGGGAGGVSRASNPVSSGGGGGGMGANNARRGSSLANVGPTSGYSASGNIGGGRSPKTGEMGSGTPEDSARRIDRAQAMREQAGVMRRAADIARPTIPSAGSYNPLSSTAQNLGVQNAARPTAGSYNPLSSTAQNLGVQQAARQAAIGRAIDAARGIPMDASIPGRAALADQNYRIASSGPYASRVYDDPDLRDPAARTIGERVGDAWNRVASGLETGYNTVAGLLGDEAAAFREEQRWAVPGGQEMVATAPLSSRPPPSSYRAASTVAEAGPVNQEVAKATTPPAPKQIVDRIAPDMPAPPPPAMGNPFRLNGNKLRNQVRDTIAGQMTPRAVPAAEAPGAVETVAGETVSANPMQDGNWNPGTNPMQDGTWREAAGPSMSPSQVPKQPGGLLGAYNAPGQGGDASATNRELQQMAEMIANAGRNTTAATTAGTTTPPTNNPMGQYGLPKWYWDWLSTNGIQGTWANPGLLA